MIAESTRNHHAVSRLKYSLYRVHARGPLWLLDFLGGNINIIILEVSDVAGADDHIHHRQLHCVPGSGTFESFRIKLF